MDGWGVRKHPVVLRLRCGDGLLLEGSVPFLYPEVRDEHGNHLAGFWESLWSRGVVGRPLWAQLSPVHPSLTLHQAQSRVGATGGISLERPCQGNPQAGG